MSKQFFSLRKSCCCLISLKSCVVNWVFLWKTGRPMVLLQIQRLLGNFRIYSLFWGFYRKLRRILWSFDQISTHFSWNWRVHGLNSVELRLNFHFLHFHPSQWAKSANIRKLSKKVKQKSAKIRTSIPTGSKIHKIRCA